MLEHALRPLFAYLRAVTVPTGVFAASEDWGSGNGGSGSGGDLREGALADRVRRAASELADLVAGRPAASGKPNPFDDVPDFESLLRG